MNDNAKDLEDIEKYRDHHYLTVGKLKEWIEKFDVPNDALVCVQRVEDVYYEKHGWKTIKRQDHIYKDYLQEYTPVWSPCDYEQDKEDNVLLLDLHY